MTLHEDGERSRDGDVEKRHSAVTDIEMRGAGEGHE